MAWTQENLDELEAAMATGALKVEFSHPGGNKKVEYRSLAEMRKIRILIMESLGLINGSTRRKYPTYSSGLH